jgi:hypothetical protein
MITTPRDTLNLQRARLEQLQAVNKKFRNERPLLIKGCEGSTPEDGDHRLYNWLYYKDVWPLLNEPIYTRGILPNEVVFDPDTTDYLAMKQETQKLIDYLVQQEIPYELAYSGGKGFHVDIFNDAPEIDTEDLKEARELDIDVFKCMRATLAKELLKNSGADPDKMGLDWKKINFTTRGSLGSMIREYGTTRSNGKYKTMVDEIPESLPDDLPLRFPDKPPKLWTFSGTIFHEAVREAIKAEITRARTRNEYSFENLDFAGTDIMTFPCMQKLQGLKSGRYYALFSAMLLCKKCGYSEPDTEKTLRNIVTMFDGLSKSDQELRVKNAMNAYDGDYHFSCRTLKDSVGPGLCNYSVCPLKKKISAAKEVETKPACPTVVNYQTEEIPPIDIELLKKYLGEEHFIIDGINYLCTNTDGYIEYALQNMICALSTVVKRRLMLRLTIGKIYPNVWNINFGISTLSRKTTMQMLTLDIMRGANLDVFLPQDFTPEALISEMAVRTVTEKNTKNGPERVERVNGDGRLNSKKAMWRDEYSSFVGGMGKSYNQSLKETLCHFYDCPSDYDRALRREHFYLEQIYFVINANTTIPAFSKVIDPFIDFMSGWLIRHTVVNPTYEKPSKRIQIMPPDQIRKRNKLSDFLRWLDQGLGNNIIDVGADPRALEYWNEWVEKRTDEIRKSQDEVEAAVFGRYNIIALKLAMLFELGKEFKNTDDSSSERNEINTLNSLIISLDSVLCAIYLIDNVYLRYFREVKELIELNNLKDLIQVTLHALKKHRTLSRSKMLRETKLMSRELDEAIKTLEERGQLYIFVDAPNDTRKKPVIMYQYIPVADTTVVSSYPSEPVEVSL